MTTIDRLVDRFLAWPIPVSVCSDICVTLQQQGRSGTHLLTAYEAREMILHLLNGIPLLRDYVEALDDSKAAMSEPDKKASIEPVAYDDVKVLIAKAGKAERSDEAMKFAQAALNAANALLGLRNLARETETAGNPFANKG